MQKMENTTETLEDLARYAASVRAASTVTTNQENYGQPEMLQQITQQFTETLTQLTQRMAQQPPPRPTIPFRLTFTGTEQEDPAYFLDQMRLYFDKYHIIDDAEKVDIITEQLRGDARRWYEPFRNTRETFDTFRRRFEHHFCSSQRITTAATKLYGETQRTNETAAAFIMKKKALFQRLAPGTNDEYRAGLITNQLLPEIKSRIRGMKFVDIEELIEITTQIETDLGEIRKDREYSRNQTEKTTQNTPNQTYPRNTNNPRENQTEGRARGPPTPCKFCGGWHYNNQCEKNPYRMAAGTSRNTTNNTVQPSKNEERNRAGESTNIPTHDN